METCNIFFVTILAWLSQFPNFQPKIARTKAAYNIPPYQNFLVIVLGVWSVLQSRKKILTQMDEERNQIRLKRVLVFNNIFFLWIL